MSSDSRQGNAPGPHGNKDQPQRADPKICQAGEKARFFRIKVTIDAGIGEGPHLEP
jgi:hypothetical protein